MLYIYVYHIEYISLLIYVFLNVVKSLGIIWLKLKFWVEFKEENDS